jgi:hypothetical protein
MKKIRSKKTKSDPKRKDFEKRYRESHRQDKTTLLENIEKSLESKARAFENE